MKKFAFFLLVFLSCQFAYADLEGNLDYMNLQTEYFSNLKFKKTTLAQIKTKYPHFKLASIEDGQVILINKPKKGNYSEIRAGFNKNNAVTWVEFILKEKIDLLGFISRYGDPIDINHDYNEVYDYYNYDFFNVSVDKEGESLYSITFFDNPTLPDEMIGFDKKLPDLENLRLKQGFVPKDYLEETFSDEYDCIYPKFNDNGTKIYTLKENIISKYFKVEFVFKDGLLKNLILYPRNIKFDKIVQIYGKNFKFVKTLKNTFCYDYGDFQVITDLQNKILQINID